MWQKRFCEWFETIASQSPHHERKEKTARPAEPAEALCEGWEPHAVRVEGYGRSSSFFILFSTAQS